MYDTPKMANDGLIQGRGNAAGASIGCGVAGQAMNQTAGERYVGEAQQAKRDRSPTIRTTVEVEARHHFYEALTAAQHSGMRITRAGWNATGQHVEAQYPTPSSRMGTPYMVLKNAHGVLVPWVPSQGDLFATDWAILPRNAL
jgi:hypothetical protein